MRWIQFINKLFAYANCLVVQIFLLRRLSISLPSVLFGFFPIIIQPGCHVKIGRRATLLKHSQIISKGIIEIGTNLSVNKYSRIVAHSRITFGDNVTIAQFVSILDHDHHYEILNGQMILEGFVTKPISIGNNVWIGDKVAICKGVSIGNNVIIGSNSVVTKDIPNKVIVAGVPAVIIKPLL